MPNRLYNGPRCSANGKAGALLFPCKTGSPISGEREAYLDLDFLYFR